MDTQHRCDDILTGRKSAYWRDVSSNLTLGNKSAYCGAGCTHTTVCSRGAGCIAEYTPIFRDRARARQSANGAG